MRRYRRVSRQPYRDHHLELLDDRGTGWAVRIFAPGDTDKVVLRNHVPNGLEVLVAEARRLIDRRLDGEAPDQGDAEERDVGGADRRRRKARH
jgi:hypothetical protein